MHLETHQRSADRLLGRKPAFSCLTAAGSPLASALAVQLQWRTRADRIETYGKNGEQIPSSCFAAVTHVGMHAICAESAYIYIYFFFFSFCAGGERNKDMDRGRMYVTSF